MTSRKPCSYLTRVTKQGNAKKRPADVHVQCGSEPKKAEAAEALDAAEGRDERSQREKGDLPASSSAPSSAQPTKGSPPEAEAAVKQDGGSPNQ